MDSGVKGAAQAGQRFQRHGADDVGKLRGAERVIQRHRADRGHRAGAVGHAEALLADEGIERLDPRKAHGLRTGKALALVDSLAQAEHRQRHVRKRRQVAGGAERALLRHDGNDVLIEHLHQHLRQQRTNAGVTGTEVVDTQEHHAAHDFVRVRLACGGAMAQDQVGGKLIGQLLGNGDLLELAETRCDTVCNAAFLRNAVGQCAGLLHQAHGLRRKLNGRAEACNSDEGLQRQAVSVQSDMFDQIRMQHSFAPLFFCFHK